MQYTAFEQLKNLVMQRRTAKLRAAGSHRAASFSDLDYFILGALSKLSEYALILSPTNSDAFNSCDIPHLSIHRCQVSPTSRKRPIFICVGWLASYHQ